MPKVAGRVTVTFGPFTLRSMPGPTFNPGGEQNETVKSDQGVVGPSAEIMEMSLELEVPQTADFDPDELYAHGPDQLKVENDNGVVYVSPEAWPTERPSQSGKPANWSVKFEGKPAARQR